MQPDGVRTSITDAITAIVEVRLACVVGGACAGAQNGSYHNHCAVPMLCHPPMDAQRGLRHERSSLNAAEAVFVVLVALARRHQRSAG